MCWKLFVSSNFFNYFLLIINVRHVSILFGFNIIIMMSIVKGIECEFKLLRQQSKTKNYNLIILIIIIFYHDLF